MALNITISAVEGGWIVNTPAIQSDMFFASGGRAESAARTLAERVAGDGQAAELRIMLRDGSLAGKVRFPAALAA